MRVTSALSISLLLGFAGCASVGERAAERFRTCGLLQHEGTLQVAGAVEPGAQAEVPFEQGAGAAKQGQNLVVGHRRVE